MLALWFRRDHLAIVTAIEFMHKFYAEHSMVTNDRFVSSIKAAAGCGLHPFCPALVSDSLPPSLLQLVSLACLNLAGKVADTSKKLVWILGKGLSHVCDQATAKRCYEDKAWMEAAHEQITRAERALLYQIGFRFSKATAPEALVTMLQAQPLRGFLATAYVDAAARSHFAQACMHVANLSSRVPLVLQYSPEAVAAGCVWLVMKMLKVDTSPLRHVGPQRQPWYAVYGLTPADLESIASQLTSGMEKDIAAARELAERAVSVVAEVTVPPREEQRVKRRSAGGGMAGPSPPAAEQKADGDYEELFQIVSQEQDPR